MRFADGRRQFLNACEIAGLADLTLKAYRSDTQQIQGILKNPLLQDVTHVEILAFNGYLVRRGRAPATIKRKIATFKVMFAYLERLSIIVENPFHKLDLKLRMPKRLPKNVPSNEIQALMLHAKKGCALAGAESDSVKLRAEVTLLSIELMLSTGIRVGELVSISLHDLDLKGAKIKIYGKGSRERFVYLPNQEIIHHIRDYLSMRNRISKNHSYFLINSRGQPASTQYVRKLVRDLARHARSPRKVTPHMLRHSAATELVQSGVDIRFIQKLLGHQSISTTEMYTHVNDNALREQVNRADVLGRLSV